MTIAKNNWTATQKRQTLKCLLKCNAAWIRASFMNKNEYMDKTNLILHAIAYKKLCGGFNLFSLN